MAARTRECAHFEDLGMGASKAVSDAMEQWMRVMKEHAPERPSQQAEYWQLQMREQTGAFQNFLQSLSHSQLQQDLHRRRLFLLDELQKRAPLRNEKNRNQHRVDGNCEWVTSNSQFTTSLSCDTSSMLWVSAGAGCGKSVLAAYLVDQVLPAADRMVCYFFFKAGLQDLEIAEAALCCILYQIFEKDKDLLTQKLLDIFESGGAGLLGSFEDLWDALGAVLGQVHGEVVCVLDAVDECDPRSQRNLGRALEEFYGPVHGTKASAPPRRGRLKFLVTSKPGVQDMQQELRYLVRQLKAPRRNQYPCSHIDGEHYEEVRKRESEIGIVVAEIVDYLAEYLDLTGAQRSTVSQRLTHVSNRTYLWLRLIKEHIKQWKGWTSPRAFQEVLDEMPATVEAAYDKILSSCTGSHNDAVGLLKILVAAKRPLSLAEVGAALFFGSANAAPHWDSNRWPPVKADAVQLPSESEIRRAIRHLCGSLVTIIKEKDGERVYLIHQTAVDFFVQQTGSLPRPRGSSQWRSCLTLAESHRVLGGICVMYLSSYNFSRDTTDRVDQSRRRLVFFDYAAQFWRFHVDAAATGDRGQLVSYMENATMRVPNARFWIVASTESASFMEACMQGNTRAMERFVHAGLDINSSDNSLQRPAISAAAENGLEDSVRWLLGRPQVQPDLPGFQRRTPLSWAAAKGHASIVQLLIGTGKVNINSRSSDGSTPLCYAALNGQTEAVRALLAGDGIDVNAKDDQSRAPLSYAAEWAPLETVALLLAHSGVHINTQDKECRTPLSYAAECGNTRTLKLITMTEKVKMNAGGGV